MTATFKGNRIVSPCSDCGGALSNFQLIEGGVTPIRDVYHNYNGQDFQRILYLLTQCGGCGRGGLAIIHANETVRQGTLEAFYPPSLDRAPLPATVPDGVLKEYREAELCASVKAFRAASALLRSVLEKTLEVNGYAKGTLQARIDEAAKDGVITAARRERAHQQIRVLGNDVLHEPWREVPEEEYIDAHHYAQRILEDFYDERQEVEAVLRNAGRSI
jgi:Domain of unknown function (DUF4145)